MLQSSVVTLTHRHTIHTSQFHKPSGIILIIAHHILNGQMNACDKFGTHQNMVIKLYSCIVTLLQTNMVTLTYHHKYVPNSLIVIYASSNHGTHTLNCYMKVCNIFWSFSYKIALLHCYSIAWSHWSYSTHSGRPDHV